MKSSLSGALAIILTILFSIMPSTGAAQDCIPEEALPVPLPPDFPLPPGGICPSPDFPPFEEELDGPPLEEEFPPFEEELDGPPFEEEIAEEEVPVISKN